jgi:hypothetical protein
MENVLHRIKVNLYENFLTEDPNDYMAMVLSERTLNVKEICKAAVTRGGAPSTAEAMEHNAMLFLKEMAYQLMDGYSVNTGYFTANAQVRGVFNSAKESFDQKKHSILFRFNQGDLLRREIPNVTVQVMGVGESGSVISHVVDVKTGSVNDLLTPNRNLKIKGNKLKIAGDNELNGLYFVNQCTQERVKVATADVVTNNPSELIVVIPTLAAGVYQLELTTQYTPSNLLKEPRTAVYEKPLTVQ